MPKLFNIGRGSTVTRDCLKPDRSYIRPISVSPSHLPHRSLLNMKNSTTVLLSLCASVYSRHRVSCRWVGIQFILGSSVKNGNRLLIAKALIYLLNVHIVRSELKSRQFGVSEQKFRCGVNRDFSRIYVRHANLYLLFFWFWVLSVSLDSFNKIIEHFLYSIKICNEFCDIPFYPAPVACIVSQSIYIYVSCAIDDPIDIFTIAWRWIIASSHRKYICCIIHGLELRLPRTLLRITNWILVNSIATR